MDGYFVEEKQQCFCLLNKDQEIFSQDENENSNDGVLYEEHLVSVFSDPILFFNLLVQ